jgi:hypothetical protein
MGSAHQQLVILVGAVHQLAAIEAFSNCFGSLSFSVIHENKYV